MNRNHSQPHSRPFSYQIPHYPLELWKLCCRKTRTKLRLNLIAKASISHLRKVLNKVLHSKTSNHDANRKIPEGAQHAFLDEC